MSIWSSSRNFNLGKSVQAAKEQISLSSARSLTGSDFSLLVFVKVLDAVDCSGFKATLSEALVTQTVALVLFW